MPVATYSLVALDCSEPESLARFYADVLGGKVEQYAENWYDLYAPGGVRLAFQRAPGYRPPDWPQAGDNSQQAHLDFDVDDIEQAQEQVLALGATPWIWMTRTASAVSGSTPIRPDTPSVSAAAGSSPMCSGCDAGAQG